MQFLPPWQHILVHFQLTTAKHRSRTKQVITTNNLKGKQKGRIQRRYCVSRQDIFAPPSNHFSLLFLAPEGGLKLTEKSYQRMLSLCSCAGCYRTLKQASRWHKEASADLCSESRCSARRGRQRDPHGYAVNIVQRVLKGPLVLDSVPSKFTLSICQDTEARRGSSDGQEPKSTRKLTPRFGEETCF